MPLRLVDSKGNDLKTPSLFNKIFVCSYWGLWWEGLAMEKVVVIKFGLDMKLKANREVKKLYGVRMRKPTRIGAWSSMVLHPDWERVRGLDFLESYFLRLRYSFIFFNLQRLFNRRMAITFFFGTLLLTTYGISLVVSWGWVGQWQDGERNQNRVNWFFFQEVLEWKAF